MTNIKWSVVQFCAEQTAKKEGRNADVVAQEMKNSLEASGIGIDYDDELDFTSRPKPKKPSQAP